jgi:ABC-type enterochelin transport system ATPase subunit
VPLAGGFEHATSSVRWMKDGKLAIKGGKKKIFSVSNVHRIYCILLKVFDSNSFLSCVLK